MEIAFYIIGFYFFGLWLYIAIANIQKMRLVKQTKGLEDCDNYYDLENLVNDSQDPEHKKLLLELQRFKNRTLKVWIFSLVLSTIVLLIVAINMPRNYN